MITIKNVQTIDNKTVDVAINSDEVMDIDGTGLTILPALIDPHVHFRVPGAEHKENWASAARAAISGGVTTVIDMPNNIPPCTTIGNLIAKHALIQKQLKEAGIPLRYHLYFGASRQHLHDIPACNGHAIGVKVFMGSSTGDLLVDDEASLQKIFQMAAEHDLLVSVHAEDEATIRRNKQLCDTLIKDPSIHSRIRSREAAIMATSRAISLAAHYGTRLCILHVSTKEEIALIGNAKVSTPHIYAEVAPHHLFLNVSDYAGWGTKVLVNPPLREEEDQEALWKALNDGTIDFIGTDHAPHTLEDKLLPYGEAPSGIPSIELLLPLMLNAASQQKISLSTMVNVTRNNIERIFRLPPNDDMVLVDLNATKEVRDEDLNTLCGWSPYCGRTLKGWPVCTIAKGKVFFNEGVRLCRSIHI